MYISGFVVDTSISGLSRDVSSLLNEYTIKETLFAAVMSSFQAQFIRQLILSVRSAFLGVEVGAGVNVYTRAQIVGVEPINYRVVNEYCPGARWQAALQQVMCRFGDSVFFNILLFHASDVTCNLSPGSVKLGQGIE